MKKMKRILSLLMAIVMLSSFMSVAASAKAPYKDADIPASQYNDLDKPTFTLNQCSSMILDFVDKTLKETNDKDRSLVIDLSVLGTLNFTSVDSALNDTYDLIDSSLWTLYKGMMGDLKDLNSNAIGTYRRNSTPAASADTNVVYSLVQFLSDNKSILSKAVDGSLDMGLLNASFPDVSENNFNQKVKGLLYQTLHPNTMLDITDPLYEAKPDLIADTADSLIQGIINSFIVGDVDPLTGDLDGFAPDLDGYVDVINSTSVAYDFTEDLLANVYNVVVVPLLNNEFKKLVREICGIVYEDEINFPDGDASNLNEYAQIINIDFVVPVHIFAPGATLVSDINNVLFEIIDAVTVSYSSWVLGNNTLVLNNLANVIKYFINTMGREFFADYVAVATPAQIDAMNNQELFSYVLRSALNSFIDNMNIPASADSLTKVIWYALKEVCAQYIPSRDYSTQPQTLAGILFMLADYAVYALNQTIDMNPAAGALPGQGLLQYGQGLDATITAIMNYVRTNYGGLFNLTLSQTDGWAAIDTLVFSVAQANWLPASVGGSTKELVVNRIIRDILELNTSNLFALFEHRADSEFAAKTVKKVFIDSIARLFNISFPGTLLTTYTTIDQIISNTELKNIVERLLTALYNRRTSILPAFMPLAANLLGLSSPQEFANPELLLPNQIGAATTFTINNESMGLNTGATDKTGTFTQDALYKVKIVSLTSSIPAITLTNLAGTVINGGDSVNCTIGGTFPANQVLMITMEYDVYTELGAKLTDTPLTAMAFSYISGVLDDGRNFISFDTQSNNKHTSYYKSLYLNQNASMTDVAGMQAQIKREKTSSTSHSSEAIISRTESIVNSNLVGVTAAPFTNETTTYDGGTWTFPVFTVNPVTAVRPADGAYSSTFTYQATKTSTTGTVETWSYLNKSYIFFYDDRGLPGLLNSELNKRRDPTSYNDYFAWMDYIDALSNAAAVVYKPRQAATFMAQIAPAYEQAVTMLEEAVTALEMTEIAAGVDIVKNALDAVEPPNTGLEYDNPAYNYFGLADYVPYTYLNYIDERSAAQSLYNSQQLPVEPVLPPDATPDQVAAFNVAHAQWVIDYAKAQADMVSLSTVDVAYALHRLNLYAGRLIRVQAVKARLNEAIAAVGSPVESQYTAVSWAVFSRALAFATTVNAQSATATDGSGEFILRQTKVDTARNKLIIAQKQLVQLADYSQMDAYVLEAQDLVETDWTPESWTPFAAALANAMAIPLQMSNLPENQAIIDAAAAELRMSIDNLVYADSQIHTIIFDTNGGSSIDSITGNVGDPVTAPADPIREGYTFAGWEPALPATFPEEDLMVSAQWNVNSYTITFDANGGQGGTTISMTYDEPLVAPFITKEGYILTGWQPELPATVPAEDATYTAQWEPDTSDYVYEILDSQVMITDYIGTDEDIIIPNTLGGYPVTAIGTDAFSDCLSLNSVTIPDGVISIGSGAFAFCSNLTSVIMPDSVIEIDDYAFLNCYNLISATMPNSLTTIGVAAFTDCSSLTSLTIPNSVTSIGMIAFLGCHGLNSVTIPENLTLIGTAAFADCRGLTQIIVDDNNANYSGMGGVLFDKDKTMIVQYPAGIPGSYNIPNSVTFIGDSSFSYCIELTSVTIPESVALIGDNAFSDCAGLTAAYFLGDAPEAVEGIFNNCDTAFTVYYLYGKAGFTNPWYGYPSQVILHQTTISFNTAGGSAIVSITGEVGTPVQTPANPTREGYTFIGWDPALPAVFPENDLTVTAQWSVNSHTLTFNANNGTPVAPITTIPGAIVQKPMDPTRNSFSFDGWFYDISFTQPVVWPLTMPANSFTIYAKWVFGQYTITFNPNGGTAVSPITVNPGSWVFSPSIPEKTGYSFNGWYYDNDTFLEPVEWPVQLTANSLTLYAKWTSQTATLTFNSLGGTNVDPITGEVGTPVQAPVDPTREGYTFIGWYPALPAVFPEEDLTVTAQWQLTLAAPEGLTAPSKTSTTVSLTWSATAGAEGYNIYCNGQKVNQNPVTGLFFIAEGLTPQTQYSFTVTSVGSGEESVQSTACVVSTVALILPQVTISVGSTMGMPGQIVSVPVTVSPNAGISAAMYVLSFNENVLDYIGYEIGAASPGSLDMNTNNASAGVLTAAYMSLDPDVYGGTIFTLQFMVKGGVQYQNSLLNFEVLELTDDDCNDLPYIVEQGSVSIGMLGDVNMNGIVTPVDALMALKASAEVITLNQSQFFAADVNKSNSVTAVDALMILKYSSGEITEF